MGRQLDGSGYVVRRSLPDDADRFPTPSKEIVPHGRAGRMQAEADRRAVTGDSADYLGQTTRVGERDRERTIGILARALGSGHLTAAQHAARVEDSMHVETEDELRAITSDLPVSVIDPDRKVNQDKKEPKPPPGVALLRDNPAAFGLIAAYPIIIGLLAAFVEISIGGWHWADYPAGTGALGGTVVPCVAVTMAIIGHYSNALKKWKREHPERRD